MSDGNSATPDKAAPHYLDHRKRLRERFLRDEAALPDYELLELLLCLAIPRRDVKPLAKTLLKRFGSFAAVISAEPAALIAIEGVGEAAVSALKLARAAALRLTEADAKARPVVGSHQALVDHCRARLAHSATEEFRVLFLDSKNGLIADEQLGRGTVNHAPVYPREVVKRALELGAVALILVHNHPSGDPTPSADDVTMTREVRAAAEALGLTLHDHLIVGRHGHASLRALGKL
ncbi:MAG TPA: DNA repair protein RadC [Alphaproteobacteria bacterium]|jgi:DNA repair protein RadC